MADHGVIYPENCREIHYMNCNCLIGNSFSQLRRLPGSLAGIYIYAYVYKQFVCRSMSGRNARYGFGSIPDTPGEDPVKDHII